MKTIILSIMLFTMNYVSAQTPDTAGSKSSRRPDNRYSEMADSLRKAHQSKNFQNDSVKKEKPESMPVAKPDTTGEMPVSVPRSNDKMPVMELSDTTKHKK